jgi:thioredoxin reductase (NADPH)
MADQARKTGVTIAEFSEVTSVESLNGHFLTRTDQESYETAGVIVTTGTEPAKLGIPGEDALVGRGISYCATCDGMFFKGSEVAVIGGGDSALSEALSLANIVSKVHIIHRRNELRAQKVLQDRVRRNGKIELLLNKIPVRINGKDQVESVTLKDAGSGDESNLTIAGVFLYVGTRPDSAFLGHLVERDSVGFIITDNAMATKTAGIFAAGDVRKKDLRQISTAVGDGALAAVSLEKYILHNK